MFNTTNWRWVLGRKCLRLSSMVSKMGMLLVLSEHAAPNVTGERAGQAVFARDRLEAQFLVQIPVNLRELGAQYDLHQHRDFNWRQFSASLVIRNGSSGPLPEQMRQSFLAIAADVSESK